MSYQANALNASAYMHPACAIVGNMLGSGFQMHSAMRNNSPEVRKADKARAYAADVRARKPHMQVKRVSA